MVFAIPCFYGFKHVKLMSFINQKIELGEDIMIRHILAVVLVICIAAPAVFAHDMTKEEVQKIIREYVKDNSGEMAEAIQAYFMKKQRDQQGAKLKDSLKNRVDVPIDGSPTLGPESAQITIVEFSDFQCPFCARASGTIDALKKKYGDNMRLVFKHFPLDFHKQAKEASYAAMAAGKQGKFWEFRSILLKRQAQWGVPSPQSVFVKYAEELKLDVNKFKTDITDKAFIKQVDDDMALGKKLGVSGTPAFFVNGAMISGAQPQENFEKIITALLAEK